MLLGYSPVAQNIANIPTMWQPATLVTRERHCRPGTVSENPGLRSEYLTYRRFHELSCYMYPLLTLNESSFYLMACCFLYPGVPCFAGI